jgi:hypothetical protein
MPAFSFSKKEAFRVGWQRFKERPFFVIGLFLITTAVSFVSGYVADYMDVNPSVTAIFGVIDFTLQTIIGMGLTLVLLRVHDRVETDYADLFEPLYLFWKYVVMTILVLVITVAGLVLFIIPGLIAAIALSFASYLVIDKGLGPVDAIKRSLDITHGHRWNLFTFGLLVAGFNIIGFLAFGVGLLVTIPVSALAFVYVYRWLLNPKEESGVQISVFSKIMSAFALFIIGVIIASLVLLGGILAANSPGARDIQRQADLLEVKLSAKLYFDANGVYPSTLWELVPEYMYSLPTDPATGAPYYYEPFGGGVDYELCATLEASDGYICEYGIDVTEQDISPVFDGGFEFSDGVDSFEGTNVEGE